MARKKGGGRREPRFTDEDDDDFRLTPEDRPGVFVEDGPRRKSRRAPAAPEWDTEDGEPPQRSRRKKPRGGGRKKRAAPAPRPSVVKRLVYWGLVLGIWGGLAFAALLTWHAVHLPPLTTLQIPERAPNIAILGNDGKLLTNRGARGQAVKLEDMPDYLPKAVIAIEDRNFYTHVGVDPLGLARALFSNLSAGGVRQGGSTITQQLAKNLFLTPERSLGRKIQELILSLWLETKFDKKQILELYLNRVYLGAGSYGVEAASERYFNSSVRDITLQQAAILAGLLKAPTRYAPTRDVNASLARAKTVLNAMVETGAITQGEADKASTQKLKPAQASAATGGVNYAADWILDLLPNLVESIDSDIFVETTLDPKVQLAAETALKTALAENGAKYGVTQGAVVAMAPDGAVRALVGGKDYQESQYNRATTARRQPGSAFKPFVYLAALLRGLTPDDQRQDAPLNIKGWRPENYSREYRGAVTLREALALSLNTVSVRLALEVGPKAVIDAAQTLGITSRLLSNASIALGTSEVTPLELTRAYAPFANGGYNVTPYVVTRIQDSKGNVLFDRTPARPKPVLTPQILSEMNDMLSNVVANGTARKARVGNWPVAGKTGTSQEFRDAWFVGYTRSMIAGVWIGNDDDTPTKHASGSTLPVEIWNRTMVAAHGGEPQTLPGAREAAPPAEENEPTIDDILIGSWSGEEQAGNASRPGDGERRHRRGDCPLDAGFLECVFE